MNKLPLNTSHWGAFRAEVEDGVLRRIVPFEHDPRPSGMNDAVRADDHHRWNAR